MRSILKGIIILLFCMHFLCCTNPRLYSVGWYVANNATGSNTGTSWVNAWRSFSDIEWDSPGVQAGDTLYISGGSDTSIYRERLTIGASGTNNTNRLWILSGARSPNPNGHSGVVYISLNSGIGINFGSHHYVTVDGNNGSGRRNIRVTSTNIGTGPIGAIDASDNSYGNGLLYVHVKDCGSANNQHGIRMNCNGTYAHEIAYNHVDHPWQDGIYVLGINQPSGYGTGALIHHNIVEGMGDDGISCTGGIDLYNNTIGLWDTGGSGHPDGIQVYAGYLRIYNNIFYGDNNHAGNAFIFIDHAFPATHNFDHVRVYNNILMQNSAAYESRAFGHGLLAGEDNSTTRGDIDDVAIINNIFIDISVEGLRISGRTGTARYTNWQIKNNVFFNCGVNSNDNALEIVNHDAANSSIDVDYNLFYAGQNGSAYILDYTVRRTVDQYNALHSKFNLSEMPEFITYMMGAGISNDLHIGDMDNAMTDRGIDLSGIMGMDSSWPADIEGVSRPQGVTWDIGAYEIN